MICKSYLSWAEKTVGVDFSDWVYGEKLKACKRKHKLVKVHYNSITYITDLNSMFV